MVYALIIYNKKSFCTLLVNTIIIIVIIIITVGATYKGEKITTVLVFEVTVF